MDIFALPASSAASSAALSIGGVGPAADGLRGRGQEMSDRFNQLLANFLSLTGSAGGALDPARADGIENAGTAPLLMAGTTLRGPGGGLMHGDRPLGETSQRWGQSGLFLMNGGMLAGQEMSEEVTAFLNELATAFQTLETSETEAETGDTKAAAGDAAGDQGGGPEGMVIAADPMMAAITGAEVSQSNAAQALALLQGDVAAQPGRAEEIAAAAGNGRPAAVIPTLRPDSPPNRLGMPMPADGGGIAQPVQTAAEQDITPPRGQMAPPVIPRGQGLVPGGQGADTVAMAAAPPAEGTPGRQVAQSVAGTAVAAETPAPDADMTASAGAPPVTPGTRDGTRDGTGKADVPTTAGRVAATHPGPTDAGKMMPPATDNLSREQADSTLLTADEATGTATPSPLRHDGARPPETGRPLTTTTGPSATSTDAETIPAPDRAEPVVSADEADTQGVTNQRMLAPLHVKGAAETADRTDLAGAAQNAGQNQAQPRPEPNAPAPDRTADNLLVRAVDAATDSGNGGTATGDGHPGGGSGMTDMTDGNTANLHATDQGKVQGPDFAQSLRATTVPHRPGLYVPPTQQMAIQVQRAVQDGTDRLSIQLRPLDLGRIDVQIEIGAEGRLRAKVIAENPQTLEMLQKDVKDLVKSLQDAGLTADQDSLSFSLHDQGDQAQQRQPNQNDRADGTVVASTEAEEQDPAIIAQTQILELGRLDVRV